MGLKTIFLELMPTLLIYLRWGSILEKSRRTLLIRSMILNYIRYAWWRFRSHPAQTILPFGLNKEEREFWERLSCYSIAISHQFVGLGIFGSFDIFGIICCLGAGAGGYNNKVLWIYRRLWHMMWTITRPAISTE